jgi:hypothetical protein
MILNNLDEIYQEVLEELSYRVGIVNLRNKKHVDILSEILDTTELKQYKSDILSELYKNVIVELKFVSKSAYLAYKDKHKMRPDTVVTIGDTETTVGAVSDTSKEKKAEPETTTKDGELKSVIAQKSIDKAAEDANDYINKINDNNLDKKALSNAFQKILNGDTLTDAEKALANDWISIRVGGGNDVGFYIAQQKGDFLNNQSRKGIKFSLPSKINNAEEWADSFNKKIKDNYGIRLTTQTGSYVNKKDYTAAKMNTKRKMVEYKSSKDGNAVTIEGNTYQKRPIPTIDSLVNSFVKKGETKEEARSAAKKVVASINRRNEMIDRLIKNGKTQMVDYGETNNNENRKKTLNNVTQSTKVAVVKSIANLL